MHMVPKQAPSPLNFAQAFSTFLEPPGGDSRHNPSILYSLPFNPNYIKAKWFDTNPENANITNTFIYPNCSLKNPYLVHNCLGLSRVVHLRVVPAQLEHPPQTF